MSGVQRESRGLLDGGNRLEFEATGAAGISGAYYRRLGKCTEKEHQESAQGPLKSLTGY